MYNTKNDEISNILSIKPKPQQKQNFDRNIKNFSIYRKTSTLNSRYRRNKPLSNSIIPWHRSWVSAKTTSKQWVGFLCSVCWLTLWVNVVKTIGMYRTVHTIHKSIVAHVNRSYILSLNASYATAAQWTNWIYRFHMSILCDFCMSSIYNI